jgi:hypothetical protein
VTVAEQSLVESHELLLVLDNYALATDGATVEATSTAEPGNLTAPKLLTAHLDEGWRSGSLAALAAAGETVVTLRWLLGGPRIVDWLGLHRSNVRVPFRVRLFRTATAASPLYESPWTNPVVRALPGDFPTFSAMPWTLGPEAAALDRAAAAFRLDSFVQAPLTQSVRVVEVDFDVASGANGGVDYLQFGMPTIARSFRPRVNMTLGWKVGLEDRSDTYRAESGALLGRQKSRGRSFAFSLDYLDRDEAFGRIFSDWMEKHGKLGRLFAWPEPEQRLWFHTAAMVATATTLPAVAMSKLEWPAATGWVLEGTE